MEKMLKEILKALKSIDDRLKKIERCLRQKEVPNKDDDE